MRVELLDLSRGRGMASLMIRAVTGCSTSCRLYETERSTGIPSDAEYTHQGNDAARKRYLLIGKVITFTFETPIISAELGR